MNILYSANKGGTRVSVLITKEADFLEKEEINGYCIQKVNAQITPEALAKLKQKDYF